MAIESFASTGLVNLAIANFATTPNPGRNVWIWSTTEGYPLYWTGTRWVGLTLFVFGSVGTVLGGGGTPGNPATVQKLAIQYGSGNGGNSGIGNGGNAGTLQRAFIMQSGRGGSGSTTVAANGGIGGALTSVATSSYALQIIGGNGGNAVTHTGGDGGRGGLLNLRGGNGGEGNGAPGGTGGTGGIISMAGANATTVNGGNSGNLTLSGVLGVNGGSIDLSGADVLIKAGSGSPEGSITANPGSFFLRTDGGSGLTGYFKESGTGNTGWAAAGGGGGGNLNLCVVSYPLDSGGLNGTTLTGGAFTKVVFNTVNVDQASAWDSTNNEYVVPEDGIYFIATKLRPQDDSGEGRSYGQGSGITIADNASFSWFQGSNALDVSRNGSLNIRVMDLDSGDRVKMFYYLDGYSTTGQVEMTIYKL
jgi:hypothetical protein